MSVCVRESERVCVRERQTSERDPKRERASEVAKNHARACLRERGTH